MRKRALATACATLLFSTHLATINTFADNALTVDPITVEADFTALPATASYALDGGNSSGVPYSDSADYFRSLPGVTAGRMGGAWIGALHSRTIRSTFEHRQRR